MKSISKLLFLISANKTLPLSIHHRLKGRCLFYTWSLETELAWWERSPEFENYGEKHGTEGYTCVQECYATRNAYATSQRKVPSRNLQNLFRKSGHWDDLSGCTSAIANRLRHEGVRKSAASPPGSPGPPPARAGPSAGGLEDPEASVHWRVPEGGRPPLAWDPEVAAHCERCTLLPAPLPPAEVPERRRQADPAAAAELDRLAAAGRLTAALAAAASLTAAGSPPPFPALVRLAEEAARRAEPAAFEAARRLAARLYPVNFGRAARLRPAQLELLWRRRLFWPACGLLLRYRSEPVLGPLMARRFAFCCCLAAQEGAEDALPHIQRTAAALMDAGVSGPLLSAWQHCSLSEDAGFRAAGRHLLLKRPAARRRLAPHLLAVLQEAQLTGREDLLRDLTELVLRLGETRLYPLCFGALLDFQCLMEDVSSARETFKLVGELSVALPSTVINRYSSLLQRHRLRAPAALLKMKYRQRPPDGSAPPRVPPAPDWWDKW